MDRPESRKESTREDVLHFLKRNGESDAKTIADFCGLTKMAISRHLLKLNADGMIQKRLERRPRGRPAMLYSLTDNGDSQFPRDYVGFALEALEGLTERQVRQIFRKRRAAVEVASSEQTKGKNLGHQVQEIAAVLTERGYMAEVESLGHSVFRLALCNCPVRDVAKHFPVACDEELYMIRNLVDGTVTRLSHLPEGARHCSYRISRRGAKDSHPEPARRK